MKLKILKIILLIFLLFFPRISATNSSYLDQETSAGNSFTAACWGAPDLPNLLTPSSYSSSGDQGFTWETTVNHCPNPQTFYQFQIYTDPVDTTALYNQSNQLTVTTYSLTAMPPGRYWWRVVVSDQYGYSAITALRSLIIDVEDPTSELSPPNPTMVTTRNFDLSYIGSDQNIDYVQLCYSFNLNPFDCSHPEFRDTPHSLDTFHFTSPKGDGIYYFATIAHDFAGNIEDKSLPTDPSLIVNFDSVQVDTLPPTTNLNLQSFSSPVFSGQNLVQNGTFSSGLTNWQIGSSGGDHQVVSSGIGLSGEAVSPPASGNLLELGFKNSAGSLDGVYQTISVPHNLSGNLSFWFRSFSNTTVDNDQFRAEIRRPDDFLLENILTTGSGELENGNSWTGDSGWRQIGRSLIAYAGQIIKLWFGVDSQIPSGNNSWTYLSDVRFNTLDLRIGETFAITFDSHDTGSGVSAPPSSSTTSVGENPIIFLSTDLAANAEATHSSDLVVLPNIVLNKIAFNLPGDGLVDLGTVGDTTSGEYFEVYNNTLAPVDLTGWFISNQIGQTLAVTPVALPPHTGLTIYRQGNPDFFQDDMSDTITLRHSSGSVVDVTKYLSQHTDGEMWQRTPTGVGTWGLAVISPNPSLPLDGHLTYRSSVHKITMSLFNLPSGTAPVTYEIIYTSNGIEKGIFGSLSTSDWVDKKIDRDFYLGSCSSNGACLPDFGIGTSATLVLTQNVGGSPLELLNKSFNLY